MKEISALLEQLKIVPKNLSIYEEAFTHSSYQNDKKLSYSYERYEFLGDALIQKIVSEHLFKKHPNMNEGDMSKSRSMIVQTSTESRAGEDLGLRACIKVGDSVIHSNGISEKIMEDVFEAFVAAVYLDQGEKEVYKIIKRTVIHYFEINSLNDSRDWKSILQEIVKKLGKNKIKYKPINNDNNIYTVEVKVDGVLYGTGSGSKIKQAENEAAHNAYKKITVSNKTIK